VDTVLDTLQLNLTATASNGPWSFTAAHQRQDPELRRVIDSLLLSAEEVAKLPEARKLQVQRHRRDYDFNEFDYVTTFQQEGRPRIAVPMRYRYRLMHAYHALPEHHHGGGEALYKRLYPLYYWAGMYGDCEVYVSQCEVCAGRQVQGFANADVGSRPEPPYPFHTIHIDHKDLSSRPAGGYSYILVVVCALTRYKIFIPVKDTKAETTFSALIDRVTSIYGMPHAIVADNAFRTVLMDEMSKFLGFRATKILPYTPQANSAAETGVKGVLNLLNKHTLRHADWHTCLPILSFALNTVVHKSTGLSPFQAVFGREPTTITHLEMPMLERPTLTGSDFVDSLQYRLHCAWEDVRLASAQAKRSYMDKTLKNTPISERLQKLQKGDYVLLRHGGEKNAATLRKHGAPSLRTFQVERVYPGKSYVRLDTAGTTILPIQSLRHCLLAPKAYRILDDGSPTAGIVGQPPATKVETVLRDREIIVGDERSDLIQPEDMILQFQGVADANMVDGKWSYLCVWAHEDEPSWLPEEDIRGIHADIDCWLDSAQQDWQADHVQRNPPDAPTSGSEAPTEAVATAPSAAPTGADDEAAADYENTVSSLRAAIQKLGPFAHEDHLDINSGVTSKRYKISRASKGGRLGSHDRAVWMRFSDMTEDEKQRVRRYMYDNDADMLADTPLGIYAAMIYGVATWPRSEEGVTDVPRNSAAAGLLACMTLEDRH